MLCSPSGHSNGWITPSGAHITQDSKGHNAHNRIGLDIIPTVPALLEDYKRNPPRSGDEVDDLMVRHGYVKVTNAFVYRCKPSEVNSVQWEKVLDILMSCHLREDSMVYIENDGSSLPHVKWPAMDLTVSRLREGCRQRGGDRFASTDKVANLCSPNSHSNGWITPNGEWVKQDSKGRTAHDKIALDVLIPNDEDLKAAYDKEGPVNGNAVDELVVRHGYVKVVNALKYRVWPAKINSVQWERVLDVVMSCRLTDNMMVYVESAVDFKPHVYWPAMELTAGDLRNGRRRRGGDRNASAVVVSRYLVRKKTARALCSEDGYSNGWITPSGEWIKTLDGETEHGKIADMLIRTRSDLKHHVGSGTYGEDLLVGDGWVKVSNSLEYMSRCSKVNNRQWEKVLDIIMSCPLREDSTVYVHDDGKGPHVQWPANDITLSILKGGRVNPRLLRWGSCATERVAACHMRKLANNLCSNNSYSNGWITPNGEWVTKAPHSPGSFIDPGTHHAVAVHLISTRDDLASLRDQLYDATRVLKEHGGYVRVINAFLFQTTPEKTTSAQWEKMIDITMSCLSGENYVTVVDAHEKTHAHWPAEDVSASILRRGKKAPGSAFTGRIRNGSKTARELCSENGYSNGWISPEGDWINTLNGQTGHYEIANILIKTRPELNHHDGRSIYHEENLVNDGWIKVTNSLEYLARCNKVNSRQWEKVLDIVMSCPMRDDSIVIIHDVGKGPHVVWPAKDITMSIIKGGRVHKSFWRTAAAERVAARYLTAANPCSTRSHSNGFITPEGEWVQAVKGVTLEHHDMALDFIRTRDDLADLRDRNDIIRYGADDALMDRGWVKVTNALSFRSLVAKVNSRQWEKMMDIIMSCPLMDYSIVEVWDNNYGHLHTQWPVADLTTSILKGGRIHKGVDRWASLSKRADPCSPYDHSSGWITPTGLWVRRGPRGEYTHRDLAEALLDDDWRLSSQGGRDANRTLLKNGYIKVTNAYLYEALPATINSKQWEKVLDIVMSCPTSQSDPDLCVDVNTAFSDSRHVYWPVSEITASILRNGRVQKGMERTASVGKRAERLCSPYSHSNGWILPNGEWVTHHPNGSDDHAMIVSYLIENEMRPELAHLRGNYDWLLEDFPQLSGYVKVTNAYLYDLDVSKTTGAQWSRIEDIVMSCPTKGKPEMVKILNRGARVHAQMPANEVSASALKRGVKSRGVDF